MRRIRIPKQQIATILILCCSAVNSETNTYDKYTELKYIHSAIFDLSNLVCKPLSSILDPTIKEQTQRETITKVKNNVIRSKNKFLDISSAVLKKPDTPKEYEQCEFFHISVSLKSIEDYLTDLNKCIDMDCNNEEEIFIKKRLFLTLIELEDQMERCVENNE